MDEIIENLKKYNYWDGKPVQTGFLRQIYLDKLTRFTGNRLVKVLAGQRRAGKSYMMRQIIQCPLGIRME